MPAETAQSKYSVASWRVGDNQRIYFAVTEIVDTIANRIIHHERPYREGAKLDDTGGTARAWRIRAVFNNTLREQGLDLNGADLFPDVYRRLQRTFETHETGDLVIPGLGEVRARAGSMVGTEGESVDTATADLDFTQDNEDALDRALIRPPTVRATTRRIAEATEFSLKKEGIWHETISGSKARVGIVQAAENLQTLMLSPGRAVNSVEQQARRNRRDIERIIATQREVNEQFSSPRGSTSERQMVTLRDRSAQAEAERSASRPKTKPFVVDVESTSIWEIAARFDQDAEELLELNDSRIANPFNIRRNAVVLVFSTRPRS